MSSSDNITSGGGITQSSLEGGSSTDSDGGGGGGGYGIVGSGLIRENQSKIEDLIKSLSVSVLGVELLENPEGFVIAAILNWLVETSLNTAAEIAILIDEMIGLFAWAFATGLRGALGPVGGLIVDLTFTFTGGLHNAILALVAVTGPFAPFLAVIAWLVLAWLVVNGLRVAVRLAVRRWALP